MPGNISVPSLHVWGESDILVDPERSEQCVRQWRWRGCDAHSPTSPVLSV